jgi:oxygen-dependent protoporphyrinogen oxidase
MAIPALARAAETESTLAGAAKAALAQRRSVPGEPVFAAPVGGMGALVGALAGALTAAGAEIRLGLPARSLARHGSGWRVVVGSTRDPSHVDVDVVVLAVPGTPAARLLSTVDIEFVPPEYASVALVALVLPDATALPELSGFLVPATEGYAVKAATFFARKWPGSPPVVRASLGRAGDEATLQRTDADLVELVRGELRDLIGALPTPTASAVYRWGGALPQYQKGHLDRVEALRARLGRGLALAGAAVAGVGIPACVESGKTAADRVLDDLEE